MMPPEPCHPARTVLDADTWRDESDLQSRTDLEARAQFHSADELTGVPPPPDPASDQKWLNQAPAVHARRVDRQTSSDIRTPYVPAPSPGSGPSISGVSGTMSNGNTITISGSDLMNQSTAGWLSFFTANSTRWSFEGANLASDGYTSGGAGYSTTQKLFGAKSVRGAGSKPVEICPDGNIFAWARATGIYTNAQPLYWRLYGMWNDNGDWPTYWKFFELGNTGGQLFLCQPANAGPTRPSRFILNSPNKTPANFFGNIPSGTLELFRWYCLEPYIDFATGNVRLWIDGTLAVDQSWGTTFDPGGILSFSTINACSPRAHTLENWVDGLVGSTQRVFPACTIELADGSTYATANKRYQAPVSISDTSAQFTYEDTTLTGTSRWVFVTDNQQNVSAGWQVV